MKIEEMTIMDIRKGYVQKQFTVKDVVQGYIDRIKELDGKINAFITLCEESALMEAAVLDEKLSRGEEIGLLGGIPVAIKDNMCTQGIKTSCASEMLADFIPPYDATIVKKLRAAGAIIIGKTNMDEFAMGSSTENSAFKVTKNPWDLTKVPGGSSGGSAAALAAGFAPLTIGSDTGGSIRQPAAFCGTVGLKPTYGLVSRFGLIAFASSLDQIGPFTKTVKDCALSLQVMQGNDPLDSTSIQQEPMDDYVKDLDKGVKGLKVGIPKEFFQEGLNIEISDSIKEAIKVLEQLGAVVEEFSLPVTDSGLSAYYIISSAEASSNLARYDGVRYGHRAAVYEGIEEMMLNSRSEGFGKEVKRRIMLGTYVLSSGYYDAYYKKAMDFRKKTRNVFKKAFESYDVILTPTSPVLPFTIGEKTGDPLEMYLADIYTVNVNIAGVPAISIPCGFSKEKLPIGLQLIGDHYSEKKLLQAAYGLEQELGIFKEMPQQREVK
ncbi:glutamyl-tRNA(Gln) amidotransferase, A subunit [Alkaliphilus metalliredigens QYMF]|uniref:Glutamyl-tRNA(Gln) amidotransferase subunit A n=1 Tax=Alkaliphilus metalliredigens (strain QYMF) TaxID=293826 RepID=GATA_ALKMQ|nr:Asp-tRNA(Asn)/Glu-tRNA(Gln) amidotransferase subunit GatA [Alkaliphilus metalliredigens]A6TTJ8.1 RecName: Full=Glutamyl-tRNA(Gln) amidotransferase subunit A; Short=Glu-ADT subunit A [Alkaliphilus metalliredigens QYMF]ABR49516.1 glutamyl-tRNA(Gln) amidotransferase, A subunit [Alkaliphilus metalliredigens QYMF]